MITDKRSALKSILESSEGVHLTAYLPNDGDLVSLKAQLRDVIGEAAEWLHFVQTPEERKKFLEPLNVLLNDARIFKNMKGNIGLFRTKDSFRVLTVPVDVAKQCHVASSFHVKPLLRWMQFDRDFLILGLTNDSAHLYFGNQSTIQKVDSILFSGDHKDLSTAGDYQSLKQARDLKLKKNESMDWIAEWLGQITEKVSPRLFVAGDQLLVAGLLKRLKYTNVHKAPVSPTFTENRLSEICLDVRKILRDEAKLTLNKALLEFHFAEEINLAKKNIFQIAKAATQGKVKKLIIADGINVYGKVDKRTGKVAIHPFDLNHEDDDILDDLAQTVLVSGGEVVIAPREQIPKGRPILAILDYEGSESHKTEEMKNFEELRQKVSDSTQQGLV